MFDLLSNKIRRARSQAGLTQVEAADRAGTSQSALARYENGDSLPTLPTLERILAAYDRRLEIRVTVMSPSYAPTSIRGRGGQYATRLRENRRALLGAAKRHGVASVKVFGSVARGEESSNSDIDLLVDLKSGHTLVDLMTFSQEAESILGVPIDAATPDMLKDGVRDAALAEALPI